MFGEISIDTIHENLKRKTWTLQNVTRHSLTQHIEKKSSRGNKDVVVTKEKTRRLLWMQLLWWETWRSRHDWKCFLKAITRHRISTTTEFWRDFIVLNKLGKLSLLGMMNLNTTSDSVQNHIIGLQNLLQISQKYLLVSVTIANVGLVHVTSSSSRILSWNLSWFILAQFWSFQRNLHISQSFNDCKFNFDDWQRLRVLQEEFIVLTSNLENHFFWCLQNSPQIYDCGEKRFRTAKFCHKSIKVWDSGLLYTNDKHNGKKEIWSKRLTSMLFTKQ